MKISPEEFRVMSEAGTGVDGLSSNVLFGYIQWKMGTVFYSPSLGPCPFKPLKKDEILHIAPMQTYKCPFPVGPDQMWSANIILKSSAYLHEILGEMGFYMQIQDDKTRS